MDYRIYKLDFNGGVHFGKTSLEDSEYTFCADTLFSALCIEAIKESKEKFNRFVDAAKKRKIVISDAFPYIREEYFLPKPMIRIEGDTTGDSRIKKAYKKLKYVNADKFDQYLSGKYNIFEEQSKINELGISELRTMASVRNDGTDTTPYRTGVYYFKEGNGLYIIAGFEESSVRELFEDLMISLSYIGIGGKRNSGLGRFELKFGKIPSNIEKRLLVDVNKKREVISLSVSLPNKEELPEIIEGSQYMMIKRSGFVSSTTFSDTELRKRDLYMFKVGAYFKKTFEGGIYDVSDGQGKHPVYRYAVPMFLEV